VITRTRLAYAAVLGAALLCYAALGAILRLLPSYVQSDLHEGPFAVGLAVGAPAITAVVTRPLGGRLADRRGPAPVLIGGATFMALGTLPLLAADAYPLLLGSRLAVGAGEGLMMSAGVLWLLRLAGPERRGRALAHIGLANYGGLTLGPLLAEAMGSATAVFAAAVVLPPLGALCVVGLERPEPAGVEQAPLRSVLRATSRAGVGLMLVNFGYVALLSFGSDVARSNGSSAAALVVPVFAIAVIAVRTLGGALPDRLGAVPTLTASALTEAAGLAIVALIHGTAATIAGVAILAAGQALAVPALGLLALARLPADQQGAAAGAFFAWFDAGVGLGGLFAGAAAHVTDAAGAIIAAAVAVALVPLVSARERPR
jgi:MFS family permease